MLVGEKTNQEMNDAKYAYVIDHNGFIIGADIHYNGNELPDNFVLDFVPPELGIIRPKWNGSIWIEGETLEEKSEREALQLLELLKPSSDEITNAELEIKILTMLKEVEVVQ